jgi:Sortase domain
MRAAAAGLALGLALAVGAPATWALTRPSAAAGAPLAQALRTPPVPSLPPAAPAVPGPSVVTRDAALRPPAERPVPVRLAVPSLGITAPVEPAGVAGDGQMALPEDVDRLGWYRFGPVPGGPGSAVIAGHVDDLEQGLGALAPLREVAVGEQVEVTDGAGTATRWRVVSRTLVHKPELPLGELFGRIGPPRLVLMTCGGEFLRAQRSYRDSVVVVAEPDR